MQLNSINILKYVSGFLLAAFLFMTANASLAAGTSSTSEVSGYVTVTSIDGNVKRVKQGDEFNEGDVINTGSDSSISIVLPNGDVITVGALSSYTVGKSISGSNAGTGFGNRSLNAKSPTLSTATSAGGRINNPNSPAPTTPPSGGSPTN